MDERLLQGAEEYLGKGEKAKRKPTRNTGGTTSAKTMGRYYWLKVYSHHLR